VQARDRNNGRIDTNNTGNLVVRFGAPTSPEAASPPIFANESFETSSANNRFTPPLQDSATPNQGLAAFQRVPNIDFGGTSSTGMYAPDFDPGSDGGPSDFSAVIGPLTLTGDSVMEFDHFFRTESAFDGGVMELAIGAPAFNATPFPDNTSTFDLGNHMIENGYNGKLDGTFNGVILSMLQGRRAFTGSRELSNVKISLRAFAGGLLNPNALPVYVRFRMTSDVLTTAGPASGWYIDNVVVHNLAGCPAPTPTPTPTPVVTCLEDDDSQIAYSSAWHLVNNDSASGGHFRYHTGNSANHSASLTFTVPSGSIGSISYSFAKSPTGGQAGIYLDGVLKQTINYAGSVGSTKAPEFKPEYKVQYTGLTSGNHKLEIKNMSGVVYLDRLCLESSSATGQPTSGPGTTSNESSTAAPGQTASSNYQPQPGSEEITVTAESSLSVPFKVVLVDPSGLTLQTADAVSGIATVTAPVNQQGVYVIKVVNLSLGPLQFTTTTTPLVKRGNLSSMTFFEYQRYVVGPTILVDMLVRLLSRV
jgi:hypothetical protein